MFWSTVQFVRKIVTSLGFLFSCNRMKCVPVAEVPNCGFVKRSVTCAYKQKKNQLSFESALKENIPRRMYVVQKLQIYQEFQFSHDFSCRFLISSHNIRFTS